MSTHKKLISYNTEKHPEVARFFKELQETNLTSHYVREAIKFYEQYKNKVTSTIQVQSIDRSSVETKPIEKKKIEEPVQSPKRNKERQGDLESNKKDFVDFDPTSIFE